MRGNKREENEEREIRGSKSWSSEGWRRELEEGVY